MWEVNGQHRGEPEVKSGVGRLREPPGAGGEALVFVR